MAIKICDYNNCTGCGACVLACPKKCIALKSDSEGFLRPMINNDCVECGLCRKTCPVNNNNSKNSSYAIKAYAAMNKDDEVRKTSSSGGVFTAIAESVIDEGGVVFGATFDNNFSLKHTFVETKDKLSILKGSKYVQSELGNSYNQVKFFLDNNRTVLFVGTPCQIEGLYAFLKQDHDNLITIDFVCHGVPSPAIWKKYCDYRRSEANAEISSISFRNKDESWKDYSIVYSFCNNKAYRVHHDHDPYMQLFINNFSLRPSCYNCSFKKSPAVSDLTLADFWGVEYYLDNFDDDKGTSVIVVNSKKGDKYFSSISNSIKSKETELSIFSANNYCYLHSVNMPKSRKYLFEQMQKKISLWHLIISNA